MGERCKIANFNPRPPRGGRHRLLAMQNDRQVFQSTPPARGATILFRQLACFNIISIHAPREGGDQLTPFNAKGGY